MRMRTCRILLVQMTGLAIACAVQAQPTDHGYGAVDETTRATVVAMPDDSDRASARPTAGGHDTPSRNMSMNRVLARYGAPVTRHPAVGQPPITRWDYPGYRLYFENNHVLHAVRPQAPVPVAHTGELATDTP